MGGRRLVVGRHREAGRWLIVFGWAGSEARRTGGGDVFTGTALGYYSVIGELNHVNPRHSSSHLNQMFSAPSDNVAHTEQAQRLTR
jgi:hypothetical protein